VDTPLDTFFVRVTPALDAPPPPLLFEPEAEAEEEGRATAA